MASASSHVAPLFDKLKEFVIARKVEKRNIYICKRQLGRDFLREDKDNCHEIK
jgi:hypothetical protein